MAYVKPQSPIQSGDNHIYPLTTYDQIILPDNSRWDGAASSYALKTDLESYATKEFAHNKVAYNLLDNSDFTNPVNQRGLTTYNGGGPSIDRWIAGVSAVTVSVTETGITVGGGDPTYGTPFIQKVPKNLVGKTITFAVCDSNGVITIATGVVQTDAGVIASTDWGGIQFYRPSSENTTWAQIYVNYGNSHTFRWAALYEGSYTAETLPEYVPKGYGAELAECMRYYQKRDKPILVSQAAQDTVVSGFNFMFPMRATPTIIIYDEQGTTNTMSTWTDAVGVTHGITVSQIAYVSKWGVGYMVINSPPTTNGRVLYKYEAVADL